MDLDLGKVTLGTLIAIFIGVIFVMAIIPSIADEKSAMTDKSSVVNETLDISSAWVTSGYNSTITFTVDEAPSGWKNTSCPLSGITWANDSVDFTVTTDYSVATDTGVVTIVPTAVMNRSGNDTVISYTHCRDGYATESSTRAIVNLILVFSGLAVMGFVVFHIFKK